MRYVLDTNVVSALRVRGRDPSVETWAASVPMGDQFVTAMSIAEIERGVAAKQRTDPAQGEVLRRWFQDRVLSAFADRVLAFDLPAARILATSRVRQRAPLDHALIAAVAESAGMVVVTRNIRHFKIFGTRCINPWKLELTTPEFRAARTGPSVTPNFTISLAMVSAVVRFVIEANWPTASGVFQF